MSAVTIAPKARKIGKPRTLTQAEIDNRRRTLEREYGTREELERRKDLYPLSADEFWALDELEWLAAE